MELFLISPPYFELGPLQIDQIKGLTDMGELTFHLRVPTVEIDKLKFFLDKIPPLYLRKTVIHQHYSLIDEYPLKGIHLSEKARSGSSEVDMKHWRTKTLSISSSFHHLHFQEITLFDYIFLSPVFNSISKKNYPGTLDLNLIASTISDYRQQGLLCKIVALGGVDAEKIPALRTHHFDGIAVLGAVWEAPSPYKALQKILNEIKNNA